jgi:hypothetical protein
LWRFSEETVSFLRPRERRAAITRRPFAVDMRSRKPCLFRRLRLEGWNVRFMIEFSLNRIAKVIVFGFQPNPIAFFSF